MIPTGSHSYSPSPSLCFSVCLCVCWDIHTLIFSLSLRVCVQDMKWVFRFITVVCV